MDNTKHPTHYRPQDICVHVWEYFCIQEKLNDQQQQQFADYYTLLQIWNKKHNITAITKPERVVSDHFQDSLAIRRFVSLEKQVGICDVGSGGGFPGIPLKICYPDVPFVLIEVNHKKIQFLQTVIDTLSLPRITIYTHDWRTFLRQPSRARPPYSPTPYSFADHSPAPYSPVPYSLDLFLARASLQPEELIRVFKPSSPYKDATLVYWASHTWQPSSLVTPFIQTQKSYIIDDKLRTLVFLAT